MCTDKGRSTFLRGILWICKSKYTSLNNKKKKRKIKVCASTTKNKSVSVRNRYIGLNKGSEV